MPTLQTTTEITEQVEFADVPGALVIYEIRTTTSRTFTGTAPGYGYPKVTRTTTEGITSRAAIDEYLASGQGELHRVAGDRFPVLCTPEHMRVLREQGFPAFEDIWHKHKTKPYTETSGGTTNLDLIVLLQGSGHMAFWPDGRPVPVAFQFDYMSGHVHNADYDLDKVAAILSARTDIKFLPSTDRYDKSTSVIKAIPYYNCDEARDKHIPFIWQPTQEDYSRMWGWILTKKSKYPSTQKHEAVRALDLLGIESARID